MAELRSVHSPVCGIFDRPNGSLVRQLLKGDEFEVASTHDGWCAGQRCAKGKEKYSGFVKESDLGPHFRPTHRVQTNAAHIYRHLDIKSGKLVTLPHLAKIASLEIIDGFVRTEDGFISLAQVSEIDFAMTDFVSAAERYIGVPYLWGGNSMFGIDCSGLVSAGFRAIEREELCPGDSGDQEAQIGTEIPDFDALETGDLVFWKGHVGIMQSASQLLHANAHFMCVSSEPLARARKRVLESGGGDITRIKRP